MPAQDIFVGLAAGAVGCYFIAGALLDAPWLMNLNKPRLLSESIGRTAARCVLAALGILVIVIGSLIASGWRIHWS
jgi:Immunity protein 17